ncbi:MAG: D-aminoacyl-tRNA deacylase [Pseudomonadota bacterium]|nr:D-aminoacyl-tRNA deacylase [Pseudomonadota bacterium]
MIALIQRVSEARIDVACTTVASISQGLVIFLAVEPGDNSTVCKNLCAKTIGYRIFPDTHGKMNLNVGQTKGEILVVSQFTLSADTTKGLRPSLRAADPDIAEPLYELFVEQIRTFGIPTQTGVFGAHMVVTLVNDGPTTFMLKS